MPCAFLERGYRPLGSWIRSALNIHQMNNSVVKKLSEKINWFPGHMKKALRLMDENSYKADVFLQVRDARLPYCSRNPEFQAIIKRHQKEKIIIFNKYDLCDPLRTDKIILDYNSYGIKCFPVSTAKHDDMRKILALLKDNYKHKYKQVGLWFMICGTPNVGKSTIINQIRNISDLENKNATAKATASVCTTRGMNGFKILNHPLMFLMDNPGVMIPSIIPNELGIKMAALGIIKEQIVDKMLLVEFIVQEFQKAKNDKYWKNFRIQQPRNAAQYIDFVRQKHRIYDSDAVLDRILTYFREGNLGLVTLDEPIKV